MIADLPPQQFAVVLISIYVVVCAVARLVEIAWRGRR